MKCIAWTKEYSLFHPLGKAVDSNGRKKFKWVVKLIILDTKHLNGKPDIVIMHDDIEEALKFLHKRCMILGLPLWNKTPIKTIDGYLWEIP